MPKCERCGGPLGSKFCQVVNRVAGYEIEVRICHACEVWFIDWLGSAGYSKIDKKQEIVFKAMIS